MAPTTFDVRAQQRMRMNWGDDPGVRARVCFAPEELAVGTLIKMYSRVRAWLVDLHAVGTRTESVLDVVDSWQGEWACDSGGLLVPGSCGYQLASGSGKATMGDIWHERDGAACDSAQSNAGGT